MTVISLHCTAESSRVSTESLLVSFGVSSELQGLITALREQYDSSGLRPKYRSRDIDELCQKLLCKNYGNLCYELANLLAMIAGIQPATETTQDALFDFFYLRDISTPARWRDHFSRLAAHTTEHLVHSDGRVQLRCGQHQFAISENRAGIMAALFESFCFIEPQLFAQLPARPISAKWVKDTASKLQKCLYQYLKANTANTQLQDRLRVIARWVDAAPERSALADKNILDFWQSHCLENGSLTFRRYTGVVEDFADYYAALDAVEDYQRSHYAASLGYDNEQGEISPEIISEAITFLQLDEQLDWLATNPKFLTRAQLQPLLPINRFDLFARKIPLTIFRYQSMGPWQARMIQSLRDGNTGWRLGAQGPELSYMAYQTQLQQLLLQLRQSIQATAWVLHELGAIELEDESAQQTARLAFKQNNRQGFKTLPAAEHSVDYESGLACLQRLVSKLERFIELANGFWRGEAGQSEKFSADTAIFKEVLEQLYGTQRNE